MDSPMLQWMDVRLSSYVIFKSELIEFMEEMNHTNQDENHTISPENDGSSLKNLLSKVVSDKQDKWNPGSDALPYIV